MRRGLWDDELRAGVRFRRSDGRSLCEADACEYLAARAIHPRPRARDPLAFSARVLAFEYFRCFATKGGDGTYALAPSGRAALLDFLYPGSGFEEERRRTTRELEHCGTEPTLTIDDVYPRVIEDFADPEEAAQAERELLPEWARDQLRKWREERGEETG